MAHFAELDENNVVKRVIVVNNADVKNDQGVETENIGILFCQKLLGGVWKQTSYNSTIRKNYAGIGYKYDQSRDAFIPPKPFPSWVINETTWQWEAPTPCPNQTGVKYRWDELTLSWIEIA